MSSKRAVIKDYGIRRNICCLQPGCHLSGMEWITVPVRITGNDHGRWIAAAGVNARIGGIGCQGGEAARMGRGVISAATSSPEVEPPKMASFSEVVLQDLMSHSAAQRKSS